MAKVTERAVLVTTASVFIGRRICAAYMGLASHGPNNSCRVGPAADIELRDITSVSEVSQQATEKWEKAQWG